MRRPGLHGSIAAGLLRRHGHQHTYDLIGGYGAWGAAPEQ